jgi:CrcB protein
MASKQWLSLELRLLLVVGFCGGFSTFSTFSYEVFAFMKNTQYASAAIYMIGSLLMGVIAIWAGMRIAD